MDDRVRRSVVMDELEEEEIKCSSIVMEEMARWTV